MHDLNAAEIASRRKSRGLTQRELAAYLAGFTDADLDRLLDFSNYYKRVKDWEAGRAIPNRHNAAKLSAILTDKE